MYNSFEGNILAIKAPFHNDDSWKEKLADAIDVMLRHEKFRNTIGVEHTVNTPKRYVKSSQEYFWGIDKDPKECLTVFDHKTENPQMVHVSGHSFYSMCAHHLAPIVGKAHFAYIPSHDRLAEIWRQAERRE